MQKLNSFPVFYRCSKTAFDPVLVQLIIRFQPSLKEFIPMVLRSELLKLFEDVVL